jgi:hypothetical protein
VSDGAGERDKGRSGDHASAGLFESLGGPSYEALGLKQYEVSGFLGINPRTVRRFAADGVGSTRSVELLLRIMVAKRINVRTALRLAGLAWPAPPGPSSGRKKSGKRPIVTPL